MDVSIPSLNQESDYVELDVRKVASVLVIIILISISAFYFQKAQSFKAESNRAQVESARLQSQVEELNNSLIDAKQRLESFDNRSEEVNSTNSSPKSGLGRPMVRLEYESRSSTSGQTQVNLNAVNYGNTTATGVQASCNVYRDGADPSYDSFTISIDSIRNRAITAVDTDVSLSEDPRPSDEVLCRINECEGSCQILHESIDRIQTDNTQRNGFN
jgi:hypothetical protein